MVAEPTFEYKLGPDLLTNFWCKKFTKRIANFDGLEPQHCGDRKMIKVPKIGLKRFETFKKNSKVSIYKPLV